MHSWYTQISRIPQVSSLYQCVRRHNDELDAAGLVRRSVEAEVLERFLDCGDLHYEHLVRYYGYYSNRSRGARRLVENGNDAAESIRIDEPPADNRRKANWARIWPNFEAGLALDSTDFKSLRTSDVPRSEI